MDQKISADATVTPGGADFLPIVQSGANKKATIASLPISTATQTALDSKVDKVTGKGLSTEDYTTTEKSKLAGIEAGAEVNEVNEAPIDGKQYARQDGDWEEVIGGSGTGDVTASANITDNTIVLGDGGAKGIKTSSKTIVTTLGTDDTTVPTSKAVKDEIDTKQDALECTTVKTANYTAQPFEMIPCDISAGGFTITLPSAPADGTQIVVKLNQIGVNQELTLKCAGTDKFNTPTGNTEIYLYLFGAFAQCQYCTDTGLWTTFISAGTLNFATNFPGVDAATPITDDDITIDVAAKTLTITPPLGHFNVFTDGGGIVKTHRKTGPVVFPAWTDTSGDWFFYFNNTGTAVTTQTPWGAEDFASIAPIYRIVWNDQLYRFTVTAANATLGATYTNNGVTYTVRETIAGGTTLRVSGNGAPLASGTLTKASGTGDATITFSAVSDADKIAAQYIEYHLNTISADDHTWKHLQGAIWQSGFAEATNKLATGSPNADGRNTVISLSSGTNIDDNLPYTVTSDTTPTNDWEQDLGHLTPATLNATNSGLFPIFTQDSAGRISFLPATRFPFAWDEATNRPQIISSTGTRSLVTDNRWFVYFIYATQNPVAGEALKLVSTGVEYTSLANAQAVTWSTIQTLYPTVFGNDYEIRPVLKAIFYNDNSGGGSYNAGCKYSVLRETADIRKTIVSTVATAGGSVPATSVTVTPTGGISATNAQAALEELDTELALKAPLDAPSFTNGIEVDGVVTIANGGTGSVYLDPINITSAKTILLPNQNSTLATIADLTSLAPIASPTFTGLSTFDTIKITGGTPGAGKIATSDADGDVTWQTPSGGGSQCEPLVDYSGPAIIGVLGTYVFDSSKIGSKYSITVDSIPVGSNLIVELRKNSYTSGNVLSSTLEIATTDTLTNGKKTVSITDTDSYVAGDYVVAYLTSVGSTTPSLNPYFTMTIA